MLRKHLTIALAALAMAPAALAQQPGSAKEVFTLSPQSDLTVYVPAQPTGVAVMMCPGGGYAHLALDHEGHGMASWFTDRGVAYAVLRYRLPKQPVDTLPMIDAHAAMRLIAHNAERWGVDPARIGIMGASAGGNLASHIGCTDSLVAFQALLYPVISMRPGITHDGSRNNLIGQNPTEELMAAFSNDEIAGPSSPPAIIFLSADDSLVPPANSIRYFQALRAAGVPAEMHIYPTGEHGWGFNDSFPYKQQWLASLQQWLENAAK